MMRRALVTGSASGIGAATRARLEQEGAEVIGIDLHDAEVVDGRPYTVLRGEHAW